jgi:hypothetical protein
MPENKAEPLANEDQPLKPKYDFSKVNLATGEGMQLKYDSWDEIDAYGKAFIEECKKQGVPL